MTNGDRLREEEKKQYVASMEALLTEINTETGKKIAIWMGPSQEAISVYTSYKLKNAGNPSVLILLIDELEYVPGATWSFTPTTTEQIKSEIEIFWNGSNSDRLKVVYIAPRN